MDRKLSKISPIKSIHIQLLYTGKNRKDWYTCQTYYKTPPPLRHDMAWTLLMSDGIL